MAHPREKLFLYEKLIFRCVRSYPVNYEACDILSTRWSSPNHTPMREFSKSLDRSQRTRSRSPRSPDFNTANYSFGGGHMKNLKSMKQRLTQYMNCFDVFFKRGFKCRHHETNVAAIQSFPIPAETPKEEILDNFCDVYVLAPEKKRQAIFSYRYAYSLSLVSTACTTDVRKIKSYLMTYMYTLIS
jgi:hypothetical protein